MAEAARTIGGLHVEDHVVVLTRSGSEGHVIQVQSVSRFPSDNMVRARGVAAHTHSTYKFPFGVIEREPAPEDHRASDRFADERIVCLTEIFRLPRKYRVGVGRCRHID